MRLSIKLFTLFILSFSLAGCFSLGGAEKEPKTYMLSVHNPKKPAHAKTDASLAILPGTATSPYDMNQFIYRASRIGFISDYYHEFLIAPPIQITQLTRGYLANTGLFKMVDIKGNILGKTSYELKPEIEALYADYRNSKRPKAIMCIRYILYYGKNEKIVMNKVFEVSVPLKAKTNAALMAAWNQDLQIILSRLNRRLRGVVHG